MHLIITEKINKYSIFYERINLSSTSKSGFSASSVVTIIDNSGV